VKLTQSAPYGPLVQRLKVNSQMIAENSGTRRLGVLEEEGVPMRMQEPGSGM